MLTPESGEVTQLLAKMRLGSPEAESRLLSLIYVELRRTAARYMRGERADHSLQPTALVHEAYLRLHNVHSVDWQSRTHFLAVAGHTMRRILVDHARAKRAGKRGLDWNQVELDVDQLYCASLPVDTIELDEALTRLAAFDERQAKIVEMRFFGGLSEVEIGSAMGISERTVKREWRIAKAWLYKELTQTGQSPIQA